MGSMDFQRARSDEQRQQRREAILSTTAEMLTEMPVAELSLNELSRRVGLAKSNVLRYFASREAILLELLDDQIRGWASEVTSELHAMDGSVRDRVDHVASTLAESFAARPVMCDLVSAQTSVLEHNITPEVALRHKRAIAAPLHDVVSAVKETLPELSADDAYEGVALGLFLVGSAWPHSRPSQALQEAYDADREVAATYAPFIPLVTRGFQLALLGLLAQR